MSTHFRPRAYYASAPPSPVRPGSSRQTIRAITPSPPQRLSDEMGKGCAGLEMADGQQAALEQQDVLSKSEEVDESRQGCKVTDAKGSLPPKKDKAPLNSSPVRQKFWAKNQHHRRTRTHSMPTSPHHVMSNADQTDKDGAMSHEDDEAHHHHNGNGLHAECPDTPTPISSSQRKFAYLPLGMPIPYPHCPHQRFLGTKSDTFTTPTTLDITRAEHNSPTTPSTTHDTTSISSASAHNANFHCVAAAAEKQASSSCNIHSFNFSFGGAAPPPHQRSWAGGGAGVGPRALDTKVGTWSAKEHTQSTLETTQHHGAGSAAAHAHAHAHAAQPAHHYNITTSHHQHNQHYDNANVVLASPRLETPSVTLPFSSSFSSSTSTSISSGITAAAHHDPTSLDAATMQGYSLFPHQPHTARIFAPALAPLNTFQHDQHALSQPPSQHAHTHAQTYQKLSSPASTSSSSSSSSSSYSASPTGLGRHTCSSRVSNASAGTAASRRSVFSTPGRDELERKKPLVEADDGPFGTVACMEDLEARRRGIGSRIGSSHGKKVEGDEGATKKRFWACSVRMKLRLKRGCGVM